MKFYNIRNIYMNSNISNIEIIADNKDTCVFNYSIKYIDEYKFEVNINFIVGKFLNLKIINKYGNNEININFTDTNTSKIVTSPFKLILILYLILIYSLKKNPLTTYYFYLI